MSTITVIRGDTRVLTLTLTDSAGDPFDLTGADVWFTAGDLIAKRLGDGITVTSPATGVATITLSAGDTDAAPDYRMAYRYDVQLKLADGTVVTPARGRFIVIPDVTTSTT